MSSTAFVFPLPGKTCYFWWRKPEITPWDTKTLAALPFPCPTDCRETIQVPSPCWGCFSRQNKAGSCQHCNSSPSPARGRGSAAWSAATRRSEPASRWPVGGGTVWIPLPQCNKPLHLSPRVSVKCGYRLNVGQISHEWGCYNIKW